jgi:hypothetical protein
VFRGLHSHTSSTKPAKRNGRNDLSCFVEANHAVLLRGDRDAGHILDSARRLDRLAERRPPDVRVHLGALGVRGPSVLDQRSGLQVDYDDFAGLS